MSLRKLLTVTAAIGAVSVAALSAPSQATVAERYQRERVISGGLVSSQLTDLSESGYLAGFTAPVGEIPAHVLVGTAAAPVTVALPGTLVSTPLIRVNESGTAVTSYLDPDTNRSAAVRISPTGALSRVSAAGALWAGGIDDDGTVVGIEQAGECPGLANPEPGPCRAALVAAGTDGATRVLADLDGVIAAQAVARTAPYTTGLALFADGSYTSYRWHDDGTALALEVPAEFLGAIPFAVNPDGTIVGGGVYLDGRGVPLRWDATGRVTVLPMPNWAAIGIAFDIDSDGTAVGAVQDAATTRVIPVAWVGDQVIGLDDRLSCGSQGGVIAVTDTGVLGGVLTTTPASSVYPSVVWEPARPGLLGGIISRLGNATRCLLDLPEGSAGPGFLRQITGQAGQLLLLGTSPGD